MAGHPSAKRVHGIFQCSLKCPALDQLLVIVDASHRVVADPKFAEEAFNRVRHLMQHNVASLVVPYGVSDDASVLSILAHASAIDNGSVRSVKAELVVAVPDKEVSWKLNVGVRVDAHAAQRMSEEVVAKGPVLRQMF